MLKSISTGINKTYVGYSNNPKERLNKHISSTLKSKTGFSIKSISFNSINTKIGEHLMNYKDSTNVIGQINENIWNNKKILQLTIRDLIL